MDEPGAVVHDGGVESMRAIVFGAGNIGRSFIAPVLLDAGYKVTLVDIDDALIARLADRGRYTVTICDPAGDRDRIVTGFDAVALADRERVVDLTAATRLVATAVGQRGLPGVCDLVADALDRRWNGAPDRPLDVILAENFRAGRAFCRDRIGARVQAAWRDRLDDLLGIVETSIGKMVPVVSDEQRAADPLRLFAEPYNTLILDRDAFRGPQPEGPDIALVSPIEAYVDRKLFVHNLGHAAAAYLGRARYPERSMIWEVFEDEALAAQVRAAMEQGADAVLAAYPDAFTTTEMREHVEDLLRRFRNRRLGDTVQRVGRDLRRKLSRDDRLVGAMRLAARHGLPLAAIARVYRAALGFADHPDAWDVDRSIGRETLTDARRAYRALSVAESEGDEIDRVVLGVIERAATEP